MLLNPKYLIQDLGKLSQWRCMDECEPTESRTKEKENHWGCLFLHRTTNSVDTS